jgi:uncharacterized protein (TIGR02246 family)
MQKSTRILSKAVIFLSAVMLALPGADYAGAQPTNSNRVVAAGSEATATIAINQLAAEMERAWNAGDAHGFAKSFQADGLFTNINGSSYLGKQAFEQRHKDIFAGSLKDSKSSMSLRNLRLIRPDVAIANFDCVVTLPGRAPLETRLQMVLVDNGRQWNIAAYHNTALAAAPIVK